MVLSGGAATFVGSKLGFTTVTHPTTGIFCVSPSVTGADGTTIEPLLTDYGSFTPPADVPLVMPPAICPATSYQVDFSDGSGKSSGPVDPKDNQYSHSGFVIAVP